MNRTRSLLLAGALGIVLVGGVLYSMETPKELEETPNKANHGDDAVTPRTERSPNKVDSRSSTSKSAVSQPQESTERPLRLPPQVPSVPGNSPREGSQEDVPLEQEFSSPRPLAVDALDFPNQRELDPGDPNYDPTIEAQQAFAPMEEDLLNADPLDPTAWKEALETHRVRNLGVSKRAAFLRESGYPNEAAELMTEWSRVYGSWQARAYGRAGPPGYKSP